LPPWCCGSPSMTRSSWFRARTCSEPRCVRRCGTREHGSRVRTPARRSREPTSRDRRRAVSVTAPRVRPATSTCRKRSDMTGTDGRGRLGRAVRGAVVSGRWFVILAWVAAAVLAVVLPSGAADGGGGGVGGLLPANSEAVAAQQRSLTEFAVPVLSQTSVVVHDPGGLDLATRADAAIWALQHTRATLEGQAPQGAGHVLAAVPIPVLAPGRRDHLPVRDPGNLPGRGRGRGPGVRRALRPRRRAGLRHRVGPRPGATGPLPHLAADAVRTRHPGAHRRRGRPGVPLAGRPHGGARSGRPGLPGGVPDAERRSLGPGLRAARRAAGR
jgi:hypothetical protein